MRTHNSLYDIHVNVLVSDTNFATIALALADDAVKTAHAGDFVKIAGGFYHVIKTNPRVADDVIYFIGCRSCYRS
jgi:hypothetical protein